MCDLCILLKKIIKEQLILEIIIIKTNL